MKPTTVLVLFTTGALAATLPVQKTPARPRDASQLRLLHTFTPSAPPGARVLAASTESTKGGAILTVPDENEKISSVQATIRIPLGDAPIRGPTANNPVGVYAASFWMGIDSARSPGSDSSCPGSLRAGVDVFFDGTLGGPQTPFVWYQFAPAQSGATGFADFSVEIDDLVRFTAEVGGGDSEVAVVAENFGNVTCVNGATPVKTARQTWPAGGEGQKVCGKEAAWVVEDFPLAGLPQFPVALANFTSVAFGAAGVTLADGQRRDISGAEVMDVWQQRQGGRLTDCEVVWGKKLKCSRVVGAN
ncbi:hypothetical protein N0V88_001279 [Collariella sp. IMI 366227]|nr:hypothetical protein N0V88_001279 [Collariella sp. IMI 366227]